MAVAKWYKVDFHTHTPESNCFKNKSITADEWIEAAKKSGLNAVVITDHNSVGFLNEIERVKSKYEIKNEFKVFYGIEVCVSSEFTHFLIIFDDGMTLKEIEDAVIAHLGLLRSDWKDMTINVSEDKLKNLYNVMREKIFIIPAHFAANKGLGLTNINSIKSYTKDLKFSAVEIRTEEDAKEFKNKINLKVIEECAAITGSDNPSNDSLGEHCIEGIGKQYTWVKVSSLDFNGLRQVFLDPEYRCIDYPTTISYGDNYNPNDVTHNYVSGTILKGFKHISDINIRFSPHLNCIVGGRGSGKSTLIEAIRASVGDTTIFNNKPILKNTLNIGGLIETFYNFGSNNPYAIKVTKTRSTKYDYEVRNDSGIIDSYPGFPADIYSQKEIFTFIENDDNVEMSSESPLIKMIDELATTNSYEMKDKLDKILTELFILSQELQNKRIKYKELSSVKAEISYIESSLKQFEESGIDKKRKEYSNLNEVYSKTEDLLYQIEKLLNAIRTNTNETQQIIIKYDFDEEAKCKYPVIIDNINISNDIIKFIIEFSEGKLSEIEKQRQVLNTSTLNEDVLRSMTEYNKVIEGLKETGSANIKELQDKLHVLKNREKVLSSLYEEEIKLIVEIKNKIDEYINLRIDLTRLRVITIQDSQINGLEVIIQPLSHSARWKQNLQKEFGKEGVFNNSFEALCNFVLDPNENYKNLKLYMQFLLTSKVGNIDELIPGILTESRFIKLWEEKKIKNTLNSLINLLPEDLLSIKLIENGQQIDINEGSPGQKCAAILAFILSSGKNPLIIDQPEDDLDNSLIYNLIVKSIRKMKSNRQIIIVTHNPNIPVLGDAEGIIILERNPEGNVVLKDNKKAGCIEERTIRDGICSIMEGGKEAFRKREEKYMYK